MSGANEPATYGLSVLDHAEGMAPFRGKLPPDALRIDPTVRRRSGSTPLSQRRAFELAFFVRDLCSEATRAEEVCAKLRRHPLIRAAVGRRDRLLEQSGERSFARCTIERIARLAKPFTLKQAFYEPGHCVRGHHQ
jgi:hypothetical protein